MTGKEDDKSCTMLRKETGSFVAVIVVVGSAIKGIYCVRPLAVIALMVGKVCPMQFPETSF